MSAHAHTPMPFAIGQLDQLCLKKLTHVSWQPRQPCMRIPSEVIAITLVQLSSLSASDMDKAAPVLEQLTSHNSLLLQSCKDFNNRANPSLNAFRNLGYILAGDGP